MSVLDEKWGHRPGGSLLLPEGDVDMHIGGEPAEKPQGYPWCDRRAKLASLAPELARAVLSSEYPACPECQRTAPGPHVEGCARGLLCDALRALAKEV